MNKRLLVLPALAATMALTGCSFFENLFNKKSSALDELVRDGYALKEFKGYELAGKPKDGEKYLLGIYRTQRDIIRFVNGEYHSDAKGVYEFYMGTTEATTEGAAEVLVEYTSNDKFTMQIIAPGKPWHEKYMGIYAAQSSYANYVWSIAHLDEKGQSQYVPTGSSNSVKVYSEFSYVEKYDDVAVASPAIFVADERFDEDEPTPKMFGTGYNETQDYISMDCSAYGKALDHSNYDLVHFYKKA